jgi:hypothetical protein
MSQPWFDEMTFGVLYGSIVGGVGGTLGGLLGAMAGTLAPRGKGRGLILGAMVVFLAFGLVNLGVGLVALFTGQPYGIWFCLLLIGCIFTFVIGPLIPVVRKRYSEAEMRRLQAENLRNS